jgi:hypothetical protein
MMVLMLSKASLYCMQPTPVFPSPLPPHTFPSPTHKQTPNVTNPSPRKYSVKEYMQLVGALRAKADWLNAQDPGGWGEASLQPVGVGSVQAFRRLMLCACRYR